eukprot:15009238-Ditylum_brightwellii.AAC.2
MPFGTLQMITESGGDDGFNGMEDCVLELVWLIGGSCSHVSSQPSSSMARDSISHLSGSSTTVLLFDVALMVLSFRGGRLLYVIPNILLCDMLVFWK